MLIYIFEKAKRQAEEDIVIHLFTLRIFIAMNPGRLKLGSSNFIWIAKTQALELSPIASQVHEQESESKEE